MIGTPPSSTQTHTAHHDLFLSYRRTDDKRVAPLVAALNARGISVWQDTSKASKIDDFASIQCAIINRLAHARALLVWYSKAYNASRACQWELTTAYCAAQASGGDPRRRVLVVNPEASPGHIVLPELSDQLHLNAAALSAEEMAERIAARLADHVAGVPVEPLGSLRTLAKPAWHGSAGLGSKRFVGRLREMWALHATLQAEQAAMLTGVGGAGRPGVLQVRGSGGMGKSLLAEEYALRFGAAYPGGVFWLRAFGYSDSEREIDPALREAQRDSQVRTIAMELGLNPHGLEMAEVRGLLCGHFGRLGQPFLWIVDDLPPIERTDALAPWLAPHELGRTLITTRARHINHIEKIELPQLDAEEALRLLARDKMLSAADEAVARAICEELGGHALAVDVTAPLAHDIGFAEVLDMLRQPDEDALEVAAKLDELLPVDHQRSVAATFLASIKRLDVPGRDLLRLASVLANAPIPKQIQSGVLGMVDQASDSAALKTAIRGRDQLIKASLAEKADDGAITVHTLVTRTVRFHDGRPERVEALRGAAVEVLLTKMPQVVDIRTHEVLKDWVAHARQISAEALDAQTTYVLAWVGTHDEQQGDYESARLAYQRVLDTLKKLFGPNDPRTLRALNSLGSILSEQGNFVGAQRYTELALRTRRRVLGRKHPDTLTSLNNLGMLLYNQGNFVGARRCIELALRTRRCVLGHKHPDTLTSLENLSTILYNLGEFNRALRCTKLALRTKQHSLDQDNPSVHQSLNNLSAILQAQGNFADARLYAEQALNMMECQLRQGHPKTLATIHNLSIILYKQGDLPGAKNYAEQALSTMLQYLGPQHPDTVPVRNHLGVIINQSLGNMEMSSARKHFEDALNTAQSVFDKRHPQITITAWNLYLLLKKMDELPAAQNLRNRELDWLLFQDPEQLGADQRKIARMIKEEDMPGRSNPG